jgi:molecular chaperone GrpE
VESDKSLSNASDRIPDNVEPAVEEAPGSNAADPIAAMTAELDKLAAEKAELQDILLRRQAEFENYRKRVERERSEFIQFASMELVGSLLPILDDFERALKAGGNGDSDYRRGVELIYQRLFETLKKAGLEPIDALGRQFDPTIHQAVVREERTDVPEHSVLDVFQSGYNFKGKLLRPAMVKVAVVPA